MRATTTNDDRGQAIVLVVVVAVLIVLCAVGAARLGARLVTVEQAQVAADAAALAGVDGGADAARRLAAANDGTLVVFRQLGDDVLVTVVVDGVRASARASRAP